MPSPEPLPLVVRSPHLLFVATDALLAHLPELAQLADRVEADSHRLALLALETPYGPLRTALEQAEARETDAARELRALRLKLMIAETAYTTVEGWATDIAGLASDWVAGHLGISGRWIGLGLLATGFLAWQTAPGSEEQKKAALQRWMLEHPELITSPEFASLVGHVVTGADDAVLGAAGVPPFVMALLGEHGLGLLGVDTSATVVLGAGIVGGTRMLNETPVQVARVATTTGGSAPSGAADRLARVPDDRQIRIERYSAPGEEDRFIVYVAPTQTFSPLADSEPWDLTSNIAGVAGLPAGSIRATEQAMADAGIRSDSEVVLVGYSQGGLVADAIAGSGDWNVTGLETYGDPGGGIALPDGIRGVAVRHSDDFIVATGGPQQSVDRVIVERRAFAEGAEIPTDQAAPAHQKDAYAVTAQQLDAARSPELRAELDQLDSFGRDYLAREGSQLTRFDYSAERIPGPTPEPFDTRRFSATSSAGGR